MAERQPIDAIRLLREQWSSPVALAQELYAILTARDRARLEAPEEPPAFSPAQQALTEQRASTFAPDLSASYTVNPVQVGEVGRKRRAFEADLARFRPPEFAVAEAARADLTRFDQPFGRPPAAGAQPGLPAFSELPTFPSLPPASLPSFPSLPSSPPTSVELPTFPSLPPATLPSFPPLPSPAPAAFGVGRLPSIKASAAAPAFGAVAFGPGGSVINSFGANGGNAIAISPEGSSSTLGIVVSGSGHEYRVDLYGDGIRNEKTDTVTVYVPQIDDDETIPAGTVIGPVMATSDGEYECQIPVWL